MSQAKFHKLSIRQKPGTEGQVSQGSNTLVELDGKPLKGVKFLKAEFHSRRLTKVSIDMYVELGEVDAFLDLEPELIGESIGKYEKATLRSQDPEQTDK